MKKRNTRRLMVVALGLLFGIIAIHSMWRPDTQTVAAAFDFPADGIQSATPTATPPASSTAIPSVTPTATPPASSTAMPSVTPTISPGDDEWENNRGTITLGTTITFTGAGVSTNGSQVKIAAGGDFTVIGTLINGQIYVDTVEKVKLRLSGVTIANATGPAIYIANAKKAFITLTEGTNNILTDGALYCNTDTAAKGTLFSNDNLEIKGAGSLTVTGNYKHAIASDDNVIIENGNLTIMAANKDGIHANNKVTVSGGNITINATSDCIDSEGDLVINAGTLTLAAGTKGVTAVGNVNVNGGTITVIAAKEGIESKKNLVINDGVITTTTSDDGLNAGSGLAINGGTLALTALGDGLDSKGLIIITGGYTIVYGGGGYEGSTDCDFNNFTITGGTVIGMAANTSCPSVRTSTQCAVALSGAAANAVVTIIKADGTEILNFTPKKAYATLLFTSPLLTPGATYTMYINGAESRTFTTSSMVTIAGGYAYGGDGWWWGWK